MKRRILIIVTLIFSVILVSQIKQIGTEGNYRYFKDGKQIFGKEIDGNVKYYWDSLNVKGDYNYSKGEMNGVQKEYFYDGKIQAEYNMTNGVRTGSGKEYYEDGSLMYERNFDKNGTGLGIEYYKNGMKKRERAFKDNKQVHVSFYNHDIKGNKYKRTAEELFIEAQEYGGMEMYGHAIEDYEQYLKEFPESDKCPEVKFLIAFNYHNNLEEEDKAKKHYKEFIEMYPDNPLAASAKFELENMGKEINNMEIFKK